VDNARLTTGQRLAALELDNRMLADKLRILHRMLKEQRHLINDFITRDLTLVSTHDSDRSGKPDKAMYTFVCQQRFERLETEIENMRRDTRNSSIGRKAV